MSKFDKIRTFVSEKLPNIEEAIESKINSAKESVNNRINDFASKKIDEALNNKGDTLNSFTSKSSGEKRESFASRTLKATAKKGYNTAMKHPLILLGAPAAYFGAKKGVSLLNRAGEINKMRSGLEPVTEQLKLLNTNLSGFAGLNTGLSGEQLEAIKSGLKPNQTNIDFSGLEATLANMKQPTQSQIKPEHILGAGAIVGGGLIGSSIINNVFGNNK